MHSTRSKETFLFVLCYFAFIFVIFDPFFVYVFHFWCSKVFFFSVFLSQRILGVKYPEVHCNYQSLGESLMPRGEVDNFLIPCFCRMLFKEKHPASSGRHYFFPHVGVSTSPFFLFCFLIFVCMFLFFLVGVIFLS
jgi:hypothetical protein